MDPHRLTMVWLLVATCVASLQATVSTQVQATAVSEALSQSNFATTLYSSYNFLKCTSDHHVTPSSTQDVSDLIKLYTFTNKRVKIRATRTGFHSSAGFVCSGKRDNTKKEFNEQEDQRTTTTSVTMLLHLMNRVVAVDAEHHKLTVEAGMTLRELADAAESNNMSIIAGALSIYPNLTVGGVISASAHGSGLGTKNSLGNLVTKIKWVNAKGKIIVSDSATRAGAKEVNALIGGLGLLGISTEFTLQLEPNSRTIVESRVNLKDVNIVSDLRHLLKHETPHIIAYWKPDLGTYEVQMFTHLKASDTSLHRTAPAFVSTGTNAFFKKIDNQTAGYTREIVTAWDEDMAEEAPNADVLNAGICGFQQANKNSLFTDANGTPISRATVPTNNAMLGPQCSPNCIFEIHHIKSFSEDMEFTIKMSQLEEWVQDVKAIIKAELQEGQIRLDKRYGKGKVKRCLAPGSIWLRFGQGSKGLLSTSTGTEDVVFVQWSFLTSAMSPSKPSKVAVITQTIEQLSLCKYGGRPHWGKNHERVFRHPECHVRENYPAANIEQILELQQRHDPHKVFEPELFKRLLKKNGPEYSKLCTLHYWCYCEEDAHCPDRHACQPSPLFPTYKVCRLADSSNN